MQESEAIRQSGLEPAEWEVIGRTSFYLFIKQRRASPAEIRMIPGRELDLVSIKRKSA